MQGKRYPFRSEEAEKKSMMNAAVDSMRSMPTRALLQSIEVTIRVLKERGKEIRDFDNKEKVVQQVRMIGVQPYFLAAKPEEDVEKYESELEQQKNNNRFLCKEIERLREENKRLQDENKRLRRQ